MPKELTLLRANSSSNDVVSWCQICQCRGYSESTWSGEQAEGGALNISFPPSAAILKVVVIWGETAGLLCEQTRKERKKERKKER